MAHQSHNIPWNTLASHFRCKFADPDTAEESCIYATRKPDELKEFNYFVEAFIRNLREHSDCERRKYADYGPPDSDDVLVSEQAARKLAPSVFKMRMDLKDSWCTERLTKTELTRKPCPHRDGPACLCPLPFAERKAAAFMRRKVDNDCYEFFRENDEAFFNLQLVKLLILHGEMEPVLRACHYPGVAYYAWYREGECYDTPPEIGWDRMLKLALRAYIRLNLLLCLPETWDPKCGRTDLTDYRRLSDYQKTVKLVTAYIDCSDVEKYPHRLFFGIGQKQFRHYLFSDKSMKRKKYELALNGGEKLEHIPFGRLSYAEFLDFEYADDDEREYLPMEADVVRVRAMLRSKGLPKEIELDIMEAAEYQPRRRLPVEHDPLHPENREELGKYLTYCWQVLVRCDMFAREMGEDFEGTWRSELVDTIGELAFDRGPKEGLSMHKLVDLSTGLFRQMHQSQGEENS